MTNPTVRPRVTLAEFLRLLQISKSTFYNKYRWAAKWQRELDMRIEKGSGRVTMDRDAVEELARKRRGSRATGRSPRADRLGEHAERESDTSS